MTSLTQTESPPSDDLPKHINYLATRVKWLVDANFSKEILSLTKKIDKLATRVDLHYKKFVGFSDANSKKIVSLEKKNAALAKDIDSLATRLRTSEEKNTALEKNIEYLLSRVHNHEQKTADFAVSTLEKFESLDHMVDAFSMDLQYIFNFFQEKNVGDLKSKFENLPLKHFEIRRKIEK